MIDSLPKQEPPYGLRMPPDLKERVKAAAAENNRSMNAEIVATLEEKYPPLSDDWQRILEILTSYNPDNKEMHAELRRLILKKINIDIDEDPAVTQAKIDSGIIATRPALADPDIEMAPPRDPRRPKLARDE